MSATTNPHELRAQYLKARKIATAAFADDIDELIDNEETRKGWHARLALASVPSSAVMFLAQTLLEETWDLDASLKEMTAGVMAKIS